MSRLAKMEEIELDPRAKRTRKMFQDALSKLLKEKDFSEISVGDLAEESTLNRATFYGHYTDKFDLLESLVEVQFQELIVKRNIRFDGCDGALKNIAMGVCYYLSENVRPDENGLRQASSPMETAIVPVVRKLILDGFREHGGQTAVPVEMLASTIAWAIYGGAREWVQSPKRGSAAKVGETIEKMIRPMLTAN
jgi:AcrR family transcriptional regulator